MCLCLAGVALTNMSLQLGMSAALPSRNERSELTAEFQKSSLFHNKAKVRLQAGQGQISGRCGCGGRRGWHGACVPRSGSFSHGGCLSTWCQTGQSTTEVPMNVVGQLKDPPAPTPLLLDNLLAEE